MKVVYCAGRFRAPTHWGIVNNVRTAEWVALRIWQSGAACLCPHLNTANFQGAVADDKVWLDGDLEMLERCDAVFAMPEWEHSMGARAEVERAKEKGIPVFYDIYTLRKWLSEDDETLSRMVPSEDDFEIIAAEVDAGGGYAVRGRIR